MARIRTIKPELPEDETLGSCSRDARLLFILLLTRCDDHGRFRAAPALLRSLYPYDEDVTAQMVASWLAELTAVNLVICFELEAQKYGAIAKWAKHQRVDNAGKPLYPAPPGMDSPQLAATRGGSPLDHDHDQERTTTTTDDQDPPAATQDLWTTMAEKALAGASGVKSPNQWKRKVAKNLRDEHALEAQRLQRQYPDITTSQLADVLAGNKSILKYLARSEDIA